jgi:phosphatidylglycerophosphate synthase
VALTLGSVWLGSPLPLALGAVAFMGLMLHGAGSLTPPNAVTFARLLVLASALVIAPENVAVVLPCALLAWMLDGVDGWLARRRGQATQFGALFDQETDAALVLLLCVTLVATRGFGPWVLIAGLLRYALVLARGFARGPIAERRSSWGRFIFGFSYLSLSFALWPALDALSSFTVPASVGLLLCSFAPDFAAIARARAA